MGFHVHPNRYAFDVLTSPETVQKPAPARANMAKTCAMQASVSSPTVQKDGRPALELCSHKPLSTTSFEQILQHVILTGGYDSTTGTTTPNTTTGLAKPNNFPTEVRLLQCLGAFADDLKPKAAKNGRLMQEIMKSMT